MVVLEASKEDRQNGTPEKPPRKQVKTVHQITLKERPKLTASSDTIPDNSYYPGACSENAAPEKNYTKSGKGSTADQLDGTTAPQNSISDGNDSREVGSEKKSLRKNNPKSGKDSAARHLEGKT